MGNVPLQAAFKGPFQPKQLYKPINQAAPPPAQPLLQGEHQASSFGRWALLAPQQLLQHTKINPRPECTDFNNTNISCWALLGITNHSQTLVKVTSLTHSSGQTQFQQHIKRQNVICSLVQDVLRKENLCLQHRDWALEQSVAGRYKSTQRQGLLQVHGMRLRVSSKKLQASFFNLEVNYIYYLF